jgi:hypothetical protein
MRRWIRSHQHQHEGEDEELEAPEPPFSEPLTSTASLPTLTQVSEDMIRTIHRYFPDDEEDVKSLLPKLSSYRLVDRLCDLRKGRYIRWIRLQDAQPKLHRGGTAVSVGFTNEGTVVRCKYARYGIMCCRFDQCLVFERLSDDDLLVLSVSDHLL